MLRWEIHTHLDAVMLGELLRTRKAITASPASHSRQSWEVIMGL